MSEKYSLKDGLFNREKVNKIAHEIRQVYSLFDRDLFINDVVVRFPQLELKERIYHICDTLGVYLPNDYIEAVSILLEALPPKLDPAKYDDDFGDFIYAPYAEFVTAFGCTKEHLNFSLQALREITKRFSVEFAIRDFINHHPQETLEMLVSCMYSENYHERRLVSESLRPKLPWAKKINLEHHIPIAYLDTLYYDRTRYVTRSVANHLNDISKLDGPLVIETLERWEKEGKQEAKEMTFIINHALRTLVKKGDSNALKLLGYVHNPAIGLHGFILHEKHVQIGDALVFSFDIEAKEDVKLIVDYVIHFKTKNGKLSPKVHKLKKYDLKKGDLVKVEKKHTFGANMTTRKLYEGEHLVEVQVNGRVCMHDAFLLKM